MSCRRADVQRVAINLGTMIDELGRASVFPPQLHLHLNLHDGVGGVGGDARIVRVLGSTITKKDKTLSHGNPF